MVGNNIVSGLIALILQIIYQEYKDNKEKKQLTQNLGKAENTIKEVCNKLGINNLKNLPVLPDSKSFSDLINSHKEVSVLKEKLKKVRRGKRKAEQEKKQEIINREKAEKERDEWKKKYEESQVENFNNSFQR